MKVMIVDDENAILRGVSKIISENNTYQFDIELASDAQQALQKLSAFHPDLMITDIYMPFINGLELIEKVREAHLCERFIILTGHENFNYAKQAIRFKVEDYILKPINKKELMDTIVKIASSLELEDFNTDSIDIKGFENLEEKLSFASCTTKKIINYINKNNNKGIYLGKVSSELNINEKYLCSLMMKELGVTFLQYLDYIRLKNAAALLMKTNKNISEISLLVGFNNERQMFNVFKKRIFMSPGQYREKFQKVV
jgi:two-component system response regulator YesN